jgi:ADP-ribosyl-[dinitrogen reductase] hydrolase
MPEFPDVGGCLIGIAVGDSLGLPFEGLSASRIERRLGDRPIRQSLLFGRGMLSDDTEQSSLVLEAFLGSGGVVEQFQRELARKLRNWFLSVPPGVGLATVKACMRLTVGVRAEHAGVNSAGNGAAMRSPILGALIPSDRDRLHSFVRASALITHRDPRAVDGAWAIALAVAESKRFVGGSLSAQSLLEAISDRCESSEWRQMLALIGDRLGVSSLGEFAEEVGGKGKVTGYVLQSVPVALFAWLSHPHEPKVGLEGVIRLGGDTDTTGAMLGALYGASLGAQSFPSEWAENIWDWPRSRAYLLELADAAPAPGELQSVNWIASVGRNAFMLTVVVAHGLRRLLP